MASAEAVGGGCRSAPRESQRSAHIDIVDEYTNDSSSAALVISPAFASVLQRPLACQRLHRTVQSQARPQIYHHCDLFASVVRES